MRKGFNKKTGEQVAFKIFEKDAFHKTDFYRYEWCIYFLLSSCVLFAFFYFYVLVKYIIRRENVLMETEILKKCGGKHPNIIGMKDFYEDRKRMVIIMEL